MKTQIVDFASLFDLFAAIPDEKAAIAYFKAIRWANGEYCPYCGNTKVFAFSDGKTWKCAAKECRQRFSIRVGTIFEDSKIPIRKWLAAIWLITSHRKGIASTQIARDLNVTQKTGWFMLHRLRHAARTRSFNRQLTGTIETDEGYFGGKDKIPLGPTPRDGSGLSPRTRTRTATDPLGGLAVSLAIDVKRAAQMRPISLKCKKPG